MKERLRVPESRPLADFQITNFNIRRDDLKSEFHITQEHVKNNKDVRKVLTDRQIVPEQLPAAEDCKKIERRLSSEEKKLSQQNKPLPEDRA
jgi:DNA-damage-inducible protein D